MRNAKESIRKFVGYLNNREKDGGFWLPNIQRPFVWDEGQMERLYDSILREYPIGTLLVWKTKSKIRRRKFIDNYKHDIKFTDFYIPEDDKIKMLVLDGQQRLQSLFIGLKGSYDHKELCLDVLSGDLVAPEDIRYKFRFLNASDINSPWFKFKDIVFTNLEYNKVAKDLISRFDRVLSDQEKEKIETAVAKISRVFCVEENIAYQEVDSVDNTELYQDDDIVEIFIRANAGGTPLGKSDLLFSLLSASWEEADVQMEELLEELNKNGYGFSRDFVLKSCLVILNKGASYNITKFRDIQTRNTIIDKWADISGAIKDVKDFLCSKTFIRTDKALPSYLVLIPLIYFRYHYAKQWPSCQRLNEYILRTLISGAFSGSPDTLIDKCVTNIKENRRFDVNEIFGIIRADGRSLEITKDTILNQCYGSKELHLFLNLWYDFNYQPSYDNNKPQVDHIFPQSILKTVKDINPNTEHKDILRYKAEDRNQIANCMLLTAQENGAGGKSNIPPDEWFKNKSKDYLERHLVPEDRNLWKLENYEQFIEERKKLILMKFDYLLLKDSV